MPCKTDEKSRQKYLKRFYGWRPASEIVKKLGFVSTRAMAGWCYRRGIPKLLNRPGIHSTYKLADMLGVHSNSIFKWTEQGLLPGHIAYKCDTRIYVYKQEEIENWLMSPRPAWILLTPEQIPDHRFHCILRNAQEVNHNYWKCLQEVSRLLYVSESALRKRAYKGHIASFVLSNRRWLYYPDAVRVYRPQSMA